MQDQHFQRDLSDQNMRFSGNVDRPLEQTTQVHRHAAQYCRNLARRVHMTGHGVIIGLAAGILAGSIVLATSAPPVPLAQNESGAARLLVQSAALA